MAKYKQIFYAAAALLGVIIVVIVSRPDFLSLGTIEFAFSGFFFLLSAAFLFLSIWQKDRSTSLVPLDTAYGAVVAVSIISCAAFSSHTGMIHQIYTVFAAYIVYLFFRFFYFSYLSDRLTAAALILVGAAGMESIRGLYQFLSHSQMRGLFHNVNHFSMFIGLGVPLAAGLLAGKKMKRFVRWAVIAALIPILACVVLSRCRTVYAGLFISVFFVLLGFWLRSRQKKEERTLWFRAAGWCAAAAAAAAGLAWLFFQFKPLSAVGRLVIWKVSLRMIVQAPFLGIGFGNFASLYNLHQARFFSGGLGSEMERLSASHVQYAFNDYLEGTVELGLAGLIILAAFWYLIFRSVLGGLRKFSRSSGGMDSGDAGKRSALVLGTAGSVLFYMVISFFYYPSRILPIFLVFNILLACLVSENQLERSEKKKRTFFGPRTRLRLKRPAAVSLSGLAVAVSALFLPSFYHQFRAENDWRKAQILERQKSSDSKILPMYVKSYPHLAWNGDFLHLYGRLLARTGSPEKAVPIFEQGKKILPGPFLLEDLADAYAQAGDFDHAVENVLLASGILPWRLTSKFMLARLYTRLDCIWKAAGQVQLILDTPMKTWTREGELLKEEAGRMAQDLIKAFAGSGASEDESIALLPARHRMKAACALGVAGENADQLIEAIVSLTPEEREGLGYLIGNMPAGDLRSLSARYLVSNVRFAYKARMLLPFNKDVPADIFQNDVLPYAVVNENREDWRADFFQRFHKAALKSTSVEEAVFNLNAELLRQFEPAFSELGPRKRPLSPYESLERGFVTCTEASLLLICACRAVGIPARLVIIPRWTHDKVGHAWLEVFDGGRWRCAGSYDATIFDVTWFSVLASQTDPTEPEHRIYASTFQKTGLHVKYGPDVSYVDVTHRYVESGQKQMFRDQIR